MLLASTANAINNTYDNSTGILTIPVVTVGDTTYTNVVVQEHSFTVLSYDPNPSVGYVAGGVLYNFNGCYKQASNLTCNMTLTSQNQARDFFYYYNAGYHIRLNDDKGNTYDISSAQLGNTNLFVGYSGVHVNLAADVSTPMQFVFTNIATNATAVAQLTIDDKIENIHQTIAITNIPFVNSAPPNPF